MTDVPRAPLIGIVGWKKSGKTTLVVRLVGEFTRRGFKVATVKHAHHDFQVDDAETDSARHRRAGAAQVAVVSTKRWALIRELGSSPEPSLDEILGRLDPCDLVIVEGYKTAAIPKIEVRRSAAFSHEPLAGRDANIIAVAADHLAAETRSPPFFALDDVTAIADFIAKAAGLTPTRCGKGR
jgi:molybdopterin-guanine dinucleotide biosynthesis protein B